MQESISVFVLMVPLFCQEIALKVGDVDLSKATKLFVGGVIIVLVRIIQQALSVLVFDPMS